MRRHRTTGDSPRRVVAREPHAPAFRPRRWTDHPARRDAGPPDHRRVPRGARRRRPHSRPDAKPRPLEDLRKRVPVAFTEPSIEEVEQSIIELLRDEEMVTLGTLSEDGYPHTATMHIACDGLVGYFHTFKYTRKYADILRDPKVSYAIAHLPE